MVTVIGKGIIFNNQNMCEIFDPDLDSIFSLEKSFPRAE